MYPSNIVTEPSRNAIFPSPVNTDIRPKVELQLPPEGATVGVAVGWTGVAAIATGRVRPVGIEVAVASGGGAAETGVGVGGTGGAVGAVVLVGGNRVAARASCGVGTVAGVAVDGAGVAVCVRTGKTFMFKVINSDPTLDLTSMVSL